MTSIAPRIQISPSLDVSNALRELAKLEGKPQSRVVAEILDQVLPGLLVQIEAHRVIKRSPERAKALMDDFNARAINALTQEQINFSDALKAKPGRKPAAKKGARGRTA